MDTRLTPVPLVPEIRLYLAGPETGLWAGGYRSDEPLPFWAFAWPGGVALARYVLDHPDVVAGRRVLDVGAGSGLVAIAAARAGAARVEAVDSDARAVEAVQRNAGANGVAVVGRHQEIAHDTPTGDAEVVLVGDAFYNAAIARPLLAFLRRVGRDGADVLVSDPGRGYLPTAHFTELTTMDIAVPVVLEDSPVARTTVWRLAA
ncbi:methyltransferase [Luedemannella flava]|uniref:Methyltransferase n=1 Tax=Luedemannella flava TaxID=349316 RepID=A0ABN2LMC7_9ACTN